MSVLQGRKVVAGEASESDDDTTAVPATDVCELGNTMIHLNQFV